VHLEGTLISQKLIPISHSFLPRGKGEERGVEGVPKISHGPPVRGRLKTTKPIV